MKTLAHIYNSLPVSLQNAAISTYGLVWKHRRFGGIFEQEYTACKTRETYTVHQWHDFQTVRLRQLLLHAYTHVPYYNTIFTKAGLHADELKKFELDRLHRIPFLDKNTLRTEGIGSMLSVNPEKGGMFISSSGTTGTPVKIRYSYAMHQRLFALYESRVRNWAGVNRNMKRASIGGRRIITKAHAQPPYYRTNYTEKQLYLSAYHLSASTAKNYAEGLLKFGPEYMTGYAMSNYILARFIEEANCEVPKMKAMVLSSEKLTPEMRHTFSRVYGCKSYDAWSGVENCGLISENEFGQLLISPDMGIIELLNDNNEPVKPGETGHIVCTGFINNDQPLIRYRIGDRVTLSKNQQTLCGRNMPVVENIEGRSEDIITGPDGRKMVRFHHVFTGLKTVVEAQLIQYTLTDYELNVVAYPALSEDDKTGMRNRLRSQLGDVHVQFNQVNTIQRGDNGKFKAVVSYVTTKNN